MRMYPNDSNKMVLFILYINSYAKLIPANNMYNNQFYFVIKEKLIIF